jgi:hypothetical protein
MKWGRVKTEESENGKNEVEESGERREIAAVVLISLP